MSKSRYRGKVSVPYLIDSLISAGPQSADEVVRYIQNHEAYVDKPPNRNTVLTRLAEKVKRGDIVRLPDDGRYDLPSRVATQSAATNGTAHELAPETVTAAEGAGREIRREVGSR